MNETLLHRGLRAKLYDELPNASRVGLSRTTPFQPEVGGADRAGTNWTFQASSWDGVHDLERLPEHGFRSSKQRIRLGPAHQSEADRVADGTAATAYAEESRDLGASSE